MTLSEFLLARIIEDEAQAREAIAERNRVNWVPGHSPDVPDMDLRSWADLPVPAVVVGPERVLAECEGKRIMVDTANSFEYEWVLRLLALSYTNHADYRQEWKP